MRIRIESLRGSGFVGVYPHEQRRRQPIVVDLIVDLRRTNAGRSDQLVDTLDYDALSQAVLLLIHNGRFQLLERVAEEITRFCVGYSPLVKSVVVRVGKPKAVSSAKCVWVEFHSSEIRRTRRKTQSAEWLATLQ